MSWIQCKACINKYPKSKMFEGKCPECQVEHLSAIAIDNLNTRQLRQTDKPQTITTQEVTPVPKLNRDEAIMAAARELANKPGANLAEVMRRAGQLRGKGISTGYLSPSGQGYRLRAEIESILGLKTAEPKAAPTPQPQQADPVSELQAEIARLQAELSAAQTTAPTSEPVSWIDGLRGELAKDRRTLEAIERDRKAVVERIDAAELLLGTLEGEPAERWQVLQGGARQQEVA